MSDPWKAQLSGRIQNLEQLAAPLHSDVTGSVEFKDRLAFSLTPHYQALCEQEPRLAKTVLPSLLEQVILPYELADPMLEEPNSPTKALVHRYPNRVLLLLTQQCPVYCRYCTRSRKVSKPEEKLGQQDWQDAITWIQGNPQIEEVILSGGEPLMLGDSALAGVLAQLSSIPHVKYLRISSKAAAVMPTRFTPELVTLLGKHQPLLLNLHFVHPAELTEETKTALKRLKQAGVMLASQTVLLKGVNDQLETLAALYRGLYAEGVQPYALYLCDWIKGAGHFRVGPQLALDLMSQLRREISGVMIPKLIADPPGGKVDLGLPVKPVAGGVELTNWQGQTIFWPDPE